MAHDRDGLSDLLHDLKNVLGLVHAAAFETRDAHAHGEDLGGRLDELVALSALAKDVLRALGRGGRDARPFDLRAAVVCARVEERSLALGELLVPVVVDADAGTLTDLVVSLARAMQDGPGRLDVSESADGAVRFAPDLPVREHLAAALAAHAPRFAAAGLDLELADAALVVRARAAPSR